MGTVGGYYIGDNESQFDGSPLENENCTPTSVGNGADNATRGAIDKTGGQVRALLRRSEETDPSTPGWSIPDAVVGARRLGLDLANLSGKGWSAVIYQLDHGHPVIVQGMSSKFPNGTCSDVYNGPHCIAIHPATRVVNGLRQRVLQAVSP